MFYFINSFLREKAYRSQHKLVSKYLKATIFLSLLTLKGLGINLTPTCGFSKTIFLREGEVLFFYFKDTFFLKISLKFLKLFGNEDFIGQYSQTCLNNHLHKMTTRLRWPVLSLPKQIAIQLLLYKTTMSLTRPATTFFVSQVKKNLSKTTATKLYPPSKWETFMESMHKK